MENNEIIKDINENDITVKKDNTDEKEDVAKNNNSNNINNERLSKEDDTTQHGPLIATKLPSPANKPPSQATNVTPPEKQIQPQNIWRNRLKRKRFLSSRNSVSSMDSLDLVRMNTSPSMRKKWTNFETAGKFLVVISILILILGIVFTVLGFINLNLPPSKQLPMQIIGPACLVTTIVMWGVGGMFRKIMTDETENQKQLMRLRTRVQLHALAMDMYKKPQTFVSQALEDPRIRKQLLLKLRQQNAMDNRWVRC